MIVLHVIEFHEVEVGSMKEVLFQEQSEKQIRKKKQEKMLESEHKAKL